MSSGAIDRIDHALVLNPNLASAWFLGAYFKVWNGDPDGGIEHFTRAMLATVCIDKGG